MNFRLTIHFYQSEMHFKEFADAFLVFRWRTSKYNFNEFEQRVEWVWTEMLFTIVVHTSHIENNVVESDRYAYEVIRSKLGIIKY